MVGVDLEYGLFPSKNTLQKSKERYDLCFSIVTLQMTSRMQAAGGEGEVSC